jgi:23S rRNA (uridine2552-2'-O)-methyltransferase
MKLRRSEVVLGPADDGDLYFAGFKAPVDFEAAFEALRPGAKGHEVDAAARSVHLARTAFETALKYLKPGSDFVVKVFQGRDLDDFRTDVESEFQYVRTIAPPASRDASSEVYLVGKGYTDVPVTEGDTLTVDITDTGGEGDGIAKVEGYTLFVSGTEKGETVEVTVTDVKPKFGFAERVD